MQKAESRRQNSQRIAMLALVIAIFFSSSQLFADGGTLRLAQLYGNLQVSVFTTPAVLRVGSIDVSVLVQDAATGKIRDDNEISIVMKSIDRPELILQKSATSDIATNKLFRRPCSICRSRASGEPM